MYKYRFNDTAAFNVTIKQHKIMHVPRIYRLFLAFVTNLKHWFFFELLLKRNMCGNVERASSLKNLIYEIFKASQTREIRRISEIIKPVKRYSRRTEVWIFKRLH